MKVMFKRKLYEEMIKAFGKKDLSKLRKEIITDKNGHKKTVYKKIDKPKEGKGKGKAELKQERGVSSVARGDIVFFVSNGRTLKGTVVDKGKLGVTINGLNEAKGVQYKVRYENVKRIEKPVNSSDKVRFLMDKNSVKSVWRNTDGMQPESCDTIEGLYNTIKAVREEFSDITEGVKNQFSSLNPLLIKRNTLKSIDRIKEKLREDAKSESNPDIAKQIYDEKTDTYHCRTIRDCDGHTLCVKSIDDVEKLLQHFDKQSYVVRIKNNFAKPNDLGYSDININIKLSNGAIVELQVNTTANMVAKERYGHALYEVYRSVSSNPKYAKLADVMAKAQKALYELSNRYSENSNYPDDVPKTKKAIYEDNYKHEPYAKVIREYVSNALPLFKQAKSDGVLNADTIKHFEHLVEYIR